MLQGGKTSAMILEKPWLLPINVGRIISKQSGVHHSTARKIFLKWKKWKILKTVANPLRIEHPSKLTTRSDNPMFRENGKNPRATSQTLQTSVIMLNIRGHDSVSRKRLNKFV